MRFEWDSQKEASNRKKHGIGFGLAILIFNDPEILSLRDRRLDYGEDRWNSLGIPDPKIDVVLHVTYTFREEADGEETIRIISARKATKAEQALYFEHDR